MPLNPADVPPHITTEFRAPIELLKRTDLVVSQLYDWNARENPNYPLFVYQHKDSDKLEYITYAVANRAIDRAARYVASRVGCGGKEAAPVQPVVALFANTDTITYYCTAIGIMRAGCTLFLVSTRNTAAAVADMLKRTETTHIVVSGDAFMSGIADEATRTLSASGVPVVQIAMPVFDDLYAEELDPRSPFAVDVELPQRFHPKANGIILHSSGSTGHPKPLPWTHERLFLWGQEPMRCGLDVFGSIMGCQGTPMFHGLGMFMYSSSPVLGFIVAAFKPASPPTAPTPDAVWEGLVATKADFSWSVPSFIEEWARDPEKVLSMKAMRGVLFGGAALNEEVGNALASAGVSLYPVYGCTEVGLINRFARPNPGMDWPYWDLTPGTQAFFRPAGDNTYEVVVLSSVNLPLPKTNTKVGDKDAYATSDLVVPHPSKPGLWKIIGRADEQIILSNGEKTNPVPLEKMINADPFVKSSVMFGRGKFQNGVLIEPIEEFAFDPSDVQKLEAYRNKIWPTIERVNEYAPQHSRIFKEMILVTSPPKPFQYTVKGSPRRHVILQEYHEEVEALYRDIENSSQSEFTPPAEWDAESTLAFIRTIVENTLRRPIPDDADIFRNGGDSLQATWIRNTILRAIRETNHDAAKSLPMNLVFAAPTIASLAHVVCSVASSSVDGSHHVPHTPEDLWKYVDKYADNLPARPANVVERPPGKDVVVITGTTGGFGCDTLEHLLREESVERVYAFNRKGAQAMARQRQQFRTRGLDEALLNSPKFVMVEAELHEPGFGLAPEQLAEASIRDSVTHIMHNAWKVNFNLSLPSFEADIQATRNLADLALSSPYKTPPAIIFVSSVGIFGNCKLAAPVPEVSIDDPASPFGNGYSESKWVTEHVLRKIAERTGVHTVVMRLGQVAGDRLGYWNEKEWFPALVKSALFQHCLPDFDGPVTWFPAYEAAKAFTELRRSTEPFVHLVHPRPTPWHTIMAPIAETLKVPLVSFEEWIKALEASVDAGSTAEVDAMKLNPALHLLSFFKTTGQNSTPDREPMGLVYLSTDKARTVSESLARMPELTAERALQWVAAWKKSGFV